MSEGRNWFTDPPSPDAEAFALRAEQIMSSIKCGPGQDECDGETHCPAHGYEFDDETPEQTAAREFYESRMGEAVRRARR